MQRPKWPMAADAGSAALVPDDLPDWRDGAAYAALSGLDRAGLMWEWQRRDPDYRRFHRRACEGQHPNARGGPILPSRLAAPAAAWGLHFRGAARARGA